MPILASLLLAAAQLPPGYTPFMDTACIPGWRKALGEIAVTPFEVLIPRHGEPMRRRSWPTCRRNAWTA